MQYYYIYSIRKKLFGHFQRKLFFFNFGPSLQVLGMLFIALNSPNLVHQHCGGEETVKCPSNFDGDGSILMNSVGCSMTWPLDKKYNSKTAAYASKAEQMRYLLSLYMSLFISFPTPELRTRKSTPHPLSHRHPYRNQTLSHARVKTLILPITFDFGLAWS